MVEKFGISQEEIPHFKTLHSFAFSHIDADRSQILDNVKLREYAKAEGLNLSEEWIDEFDQVIPAARTTDEEALNAISLSRIKRKPLEDVTVDLGLELAYVRKIADDFQEFKEEACVVDFTDMIERFDKEASVPSFELLIVDEAQDLSTLQWRMVEKMMENARDVYFAGDDDQAIYTWAGADIQHFLNLDADRRVLPVSYRLNRATYSACEKVISLVQDRYPKDWEPGVEGGDVDYTTSLDSLDMKEGTWYLLARTNALVRSLTKWLRQEGFPYWSPTKDGMQSSVDTPSVKAVLVYENLRKGKRFTGDALRNVWEHIPARNRPSSAPVFDASETYSLADLCCTGFDASASWLDTLSISAGMREYIQAMRARDESLIAPPRITASTIHAVKGGEADNVVLWQKLTARTYQSWIDQSPEELRALFVGMSRARNRLIFLDSKARANYRVERILM